MVRYTSEQRVFLCDTCVNTDPLENVDINFMMEEFPADNQFTIWWINLDQRDS
jgi:hypothetical protein